MPTTPALRCLSLQQPWAWAVCAGAKTIENRSWSTDYRGPVAIHAGASKESLSQIKRRCKSAPVDPTSFTFSAIIGVAELIDVAELSPALEADPWAVGPYCWRFENARLFKKSIAHKGRLQLYSLSDADGKAANQQIASSKPEVSAATSQIVEAIKLPLLTLWLGRASAYLALEAFEDMRRSSEAAVKAEPENADGHKLLGVAQFKLHDFEASVRSCSQAIQLNPRDAGGYWARSCAYQQLGKKAKSDADYEQAIALNPKLKAAK